MAERIPALSLHRPWAGLVLHAGKDVENRSWLTRYRGPLLIHAAKAWDEDAFWATSDVDLPADWRWAESTHPTGIVGVVNLVDVCNPSDADCPCGRWAMRDQYHWRLANPRPFDNVVQCLGRQRLWLPPQDVRPLVEQQLELAGVTSR